MSGLSYEYPQSFEPSPSWEQPPFLSHSPQNLALDRSHPEGVSAAFWRPTASPMTAAYPPSQFSMHSSSVSMTPSSQSSREAFNSRGARDERNWHHPPAPVRSMSLVTPDELPPNYQARYLQQSPIAGPVPVSSDPTAASIYGQPSQDVHAIDPHSATDLHAFGSQGHPRHHSAFAIPQWTSYSQSGTQMMDSGDESFTSRWYSRSPGLTQVREEDSTAHHYLPPSDPSRRRLNPG
jgi:hypothetical protein